MADSTDVKTAWESYRKAILDKLNGHPELVYNDIKGTRPVNAQGWVQGLCPFHDDKIASFGYNVHTLRFHCFSPSCGGGSAFDFIMHRSGSSFKNTLMEMGDRLGIPRPVTKTESKKPISPKLVRSWHDALMKDEKKLQYLHEQRGLTDETLKKYLIGWCPDKKRYSIPIPDENGVIWNVRLYDPAAKAAGNKMIHYYTKKHRYGSPPRLYGVHEFRKRDDPLVLIVEGEWDKLLASQYGFLAVTGTHGSGTFPPKWADHFQGRHVAVLYDCDSPGLLAMDKFPLKHLGPRLANQEIKSLSRVVLPLSGEPDDKDLTDFFVKHGKTSDDLSEVISDSPDWETEDKPLLVSSDIENVADEDAEPIVLESLVEVDRTELIGKRVKVPVTVSGESDTVFHAVSQFEVVYCPKREKGKCTECIGVQTIKKGSRDYIGSCMASDNQVIRMLRELCCKYNVNPKVRVVSEVVIRDIFVHQVVKRRIERAERIDGMKQGQLRKNRSHILNEDGSENNPREKGVKKTVTIDGKNQSLVEKRVFLIDIEDCPRPGNYMVWGWVVSNPKSRASSLLVDRVEYMEDDYESFDKKAAMPLLNAFRAMPLSDIIKDLNHNVTRIFKRDELLIAVLLYLMSPRWIPFNNEIMRGWMCVAIVGDSGTGKTQTFSRLLEYAGVGDIASGLTSTRTGLSYAMDNHPVKGWQVKCGRFPANSGKAFCLDEAQEIDRDEFKTLGKAMDEGFFQIDRIKSGGYESQTRFLAIAMPKGKTVMDDMNCGITVLKSIYHPMVIRRLDLCVIASANDIDNAMDLWEASTAPVEHKVTADMLRSVIYWVWNLKPEDIEFTEDATKKCFERAKILADRYGYATDVPIVTRYEADKTLARVSTAMAALCCSTDGNFDKLVVKEEHVELCFNFMCKIYDHPNANLRLYSEFKKLRDNVVDYEAILEYVENTLESEKHTPTASKDGDGKFKRFLYSMWSMGMGDTRPTEFRRSDIMEASGCSHNFVHKRLQAMKAFSLVNYAKGRYTKTTKFMRFFQRLLDEQPNFFNGVARAFITSEPDEIKKAFPGYEHDDQDGDYDHEDEQTNLMEDE